MKEGNCESSVDANEVTRARDFRSCVVQRAPLWRFPEVPWIECAMWIFDVSKGTSPNSVGARPIDAIQSVRDVNVVDVDVVVSSAYR